MQYENGEKTHIHRKIRTAKDVNAPQLGARDNNTIFNRQWNIAQNVHYSLSSKDYYDKTYADIFFYYSCFFTYIPFRCNMPVYLFVVYAEFQFSIYFSSFLIPGTFFYVFFFTFMLGLMNLICILHVTCYANQTKKKVLKMLDVLICSIGYSYLL